MHIEDLDDGDSNVGEFGILKLKEEDLLDCRKKVVVGVGARFLFYPTLFYNVVRNKIQSEFRWWDKVDEFLLLGAVPFPNDVPRLKCLGVYGVITMNEPYETLVPASLYAAHGIENLVLPTRDYLFAPSFRAICKGVDFIHRNASCGKTTYVHCKAGRGRSTTIVLCYLVQHRQMDPINAYAYVRSRRPRVLLAPSQWQAVKEFYRRRVLKPIISRKLLPLPLDESSFTVISAADLDGYSNADVSIWDDAGIMYRMQFAGQAALASLSCLLLRHRHCRGLRGTMQAKESCALAAAQPSLVGGMAVGQALEASVV